MEKHSQENNTCYVVFSSMYTYKYIYIDIYIERDFYIYTIWLFDIAMQDDPLIDDVPIQSDDFHGYLE